MELDMDGAGPSRRAGSRRAALETLERLLRAHVAFGAERGQEGAHGLLRPARDDELDLIEAVFLHCGVPLPDTLRAIYRRTLGVGNPVSVRPVLAVPFLQAALPDEGFGCRVVGLLELEKDVGIVRDEAAMERPAVLCLGHAAPLTLAVGRNGLWSIGETRGQEFGLSFENAFCVLVEQVLLVWANDLAGDLVRRHDLDVTRGARLTGMPVAVREAWERLVAPRSLSPKGWGDVLPLDNADLLRAGPRDGNRSEAPNPYATVVGLPYGENPEIARRIAPGSLLRLCPVDDNPHDPQAVEVWQDGDEPVRIGFVARGEAPAYRDLPGGTSAWRLRVAGRSEHVLQARLERLQPEEPGVPDDDDQDLFSRG